MIAIEAFAYMRKVAGEARAVDAMDVEF